MALSVKKVTLWRTEVANRPGSLSRILGPLAESGADLQIVMGYRFPGDEQNAAIEVAPVSGKKVAKAAGEAGLSACPIPALVVQGDNKPGMGHAVAEALAAAEINVAFLVAQVLDGRFSAVIGFDDEAASAKATPLIKKAAK